MSIVYEIEIETDLTFIERVHSLGTTAVLIYEGEGVILMSKNNKLMRTSDPTLQSANLSEVIGTKYIEKDFPTL